MLTTYIEAAMKRAQYELIEDGSFFATIPGFDGVWGNAPTLEAAREDLQDALEGWLALKLWLNDTDFPALGRLSLTPRRLPSWPHRAVAEPSLARQAS